MTTFFSPGGFASYFICISLKLIEIGRPFQFGPVNLGRFSKLNNIVSLIWIALVLVLTMLPTAYPVDSTDLNYTPVAFGIALIGALSIWYVASSLWAISF